MRKVFSFCLLTSLVLSSNTFARIKRGGEFGQGQGHVAQEHEMTPGYSAPARYDVRGSWDVYFNADFIYWQAREDNLAYALTSSDATLNTPPINGRVLNPNFGWHPGVRIGLGLNFEHDDWDVFAVWTHLVVHDNTSSDRPTPGILIPTLMHGISDQLSPDKASSSWRMIFNSVDLTLGRPFYLGRYVVFKPHAGVRGSWIDQTMNAEYHNLVDATFNSFGNSHVSTDFDTWGLGPKFALDTDWLIGEGFRIFADVAASILYTSYDATKTESNPDLIAANFPSRSPSDPILNLRNKDNDSICPTLEGRLGFGWGTYFDRSNWHVDLSLAYEFHHWWDQNGMGLWVADGFDISLTRASGDLIMHGGTFSFRLDF